MTHPSTGGVTAGHTPGPWIADFHNEQRDGGRFITYVRGSNQLVPIAAVPTGVEGYGREEGRANAALIGAAPDLWLAVVELEARFGHVKCLPIDMARAALAKARQTSNIKDNPDGN